ncbi:hypothetical protein [Enterovibrio norvegicus]|uniref:hypothetical protein n=1 Tax=Enterovibrio norvegicus TaxID=188144 RepID=UPI00037642EE|nr:hypothetical protein [Enterovibrio norvegicus]
MARKDQASQGLLAKAKSEVRLVKQFGWQLYNKGFQGGRKTFAQILSYQLMAITVAFWRKANVFRPLKQRYTLIQIAILKWFLGIKFVSYLLSKLMRVITDT